MSNIPAQTNKNSRSKRAPMTMSVSTMDSLAKLGLDKLSAHKKSQMVKNYYERKQICRVPQDILDANPDKHFVFINMNRLEKTGGWHPNGYRLFKNPVDSENMNKEKFDKASDGYIHRNEMVLAYLPKEEFEEREMEKALVKATRNLTDVLTHNDALRGFQPRAEETVEKVNIKGE